MNFKCVFVQDEIGGRCHVSTSISSLLMIVFGVVTLIFGEFTPIIVWLFGTSFLPGTCITQGQLDNRRRRRMDDLDRKHLPITPRVTPTIEQVNQLHRRTIIHECRYYPLIPLLKQSSRCIFEMGTNILFPYDVPARDAYSKSQLS